MQTHLLGLLSELAELLLHLGQLLLIGPLRAIMHVLQKGIKNLGIELVPAPSFLRASGTRSTVVLGLQLGVCLLQGLEGGAGLPGQLQHTGKSVMARQADSKLRVQEVLPVDQQQSREEVKAVWSTPEALEHAGKPESAAWWPPG